jgi:ribosomal protein L37E
MIFSNELKEEIAKKIRERNALKPCARCGNTKFSVVDGIAQIGFGQDTQNVQIGTMIPCAIIGCDNCGNLTFHALGALGLLK